MRRPIVLEVEIFRVPDSNLIRGWILVDGNEVWQQELGVRPTGEFEDQAAMSEMVNKFTAEFAYYINTRETKDVPVQIGSSTPAEPQ